MLKDNARPNWTARIALLGVVLALVGGLWWFNHANRDTEPPTAVATSCSGFEVDAHKLFDKSDAAALSGTFAPGDHVHLAIDFKGVGYSWELTGVLAMAKKADVTGPGSFSTSATSASSTTSTTTITSTTSTFTTPTVSHGDISGFARLDLEIDVTTAGIGAIAINKTSSVPSFTPPRVASASCNASIPPAT